MEKRTGRMNKMADKKLKKEKKMNRYTDRVVRRVKSYGYGNYGDKPEAVCYWTCDGGNFVSYKKNKLQRFISRVRWNICYYLKWRWE